ncbi:MAG TPA: hypothetical protein VM364_18770 [Vicinamibacterales bacterium]|nr:hypothetical protein [Vicinamibacterales bacterium]
MEPDARTRVHVDVWWIGDRAADDALLERVAADVAREFAARVRVHEPRDRPQGTFDPRRGQHASRDVLRWLLQHAPPPPGRLLGLTDVDLFIPVLTFVFGEAQLDGPAAVVSTARLAQAGDAGLTAARVGREAVHELGHTFGLLHCGAADATPGRPRSCVMSRSASVRAVDAKSARLCAGCRARYALFQQDGSHVYREHQNPHR